MLDSGVNSFSLIADLTIVPAVRFVLMDSFYYITISIVTQGLVGWTLHINRLKTC